MAFGTGKVLGPHTAKVSTLFGGGSMIVTISDTKKGRYAYVTERQSWMVLYQVDMHFSLPDHDALWDADPNLRRGAKWLSIPSTHGRVVVPRRQHSGVSLYDDGWGVPDLRQQGAAARASKPC